MTEREKLMDILERAGSLRQYPGSMASILIENGVTFATDNNVGSKWIPVTERLPEQGQTIIVYDGGVLEPKVYAYHFWNKDYDSWVRVTHWMPLPEPPEETSQ